MPPKKKKVVIEAEFNYNTPTQPNSKRLKDLKLQIEEPKTAMLLFYCNEPSVLLRVLQGLDKFSQANPDNIVTLFELNIVEEFLKANLFEYVELFIRRFTFKLTAAIYSVDFKFDINTSQKVYEHTIAQFLTTDDPFLTEYTGLVLLNLMKEPIMLAMLEDNDPYILKTFSLAETTNDPDILLISYQTLIQLYRSSLNQEKMCGLHNFPFSRAIADISSQHTEIKVAALEVLREIVRCRNPFYIRKITCLSFYNEQMLVLEDFRSEPEHPLVLTLMQESLKIDPVARVFISKGFLNRLLHYYEITKSNKMKAANVFAELTHYNNFHEMLHYSSVTEIFITLLDEIPTITETVIFGLKNMLNFYKAFIYVIDKNIVPQILAIIKDLGTRDVIKQAAADLLYILSSRNIGVCENLIDDLPHVLINFLQKPFGEVPSETIVILISTLNNLAMYPVIRSEVINNLLLCATLVSSIRHHFRSTIVIEALLNCAISFLCDIPLQNAFLNDNVGALILRTLKDTAVVVKNASCDFILISSKFQNFAQRYIERGVLEYLLRDEKSLASCPSWSLAIDAILATNPSLKFCIREGLGITDVIGKFFNVSKKHYQDFRTFLSILKENVSPLHSLISVNFDHMESDSESLIHVPIEPTTQSTPHAGGGESIMSANTLDNLEEWVYCRNPPDDNLPKYLKKLKELLQIRGLMPSKNVKDANGNLIDITKISDRVKIVAELVYNEMCGTVQGTQSQICSDQVVLNHLNYLKCHLHCNIIPLGRIRYGGEFERAILFKALADQIGLPCTLRRAIDGRILYNEVPIPVADKKKCAINVLPMRLLRPTHIVDLMDHPGEVYPLESRQAYQYLHLL